MEDPYDASMGENPSETKEDDGNDPPSIFISQSETIDKVTNGGPEEDLHKLSAPGVPTKSRPPSPSFIPGSLFRKFSHPRTPRASTQSIDSVDDSLTDQTDIVEISDHNVPERPFVESQILNFFESVSRFNKKKILSIMTNSWIINSPDEKCSDTGNALVHVASILEETRVMYALISLNANINILNMNGSSALHNAVQKNNVQMVKLLVENRADTEVIDQTLKLNPLQCAALKLN